MSEDGPHLITYQARRALTFVHVFGQPPFRCGMTVELIGGDDVRVTVHGTEENDSVLYALASDLYPAEHRQWLGSMTAAVRDTLRPTPRQLDAMRAGTFEKDWSGAPLNFREKEF